MQKAVSLLGTAQDSSQLRQTLWVMRAWFNSPQIFILCFQGARLSCNLLHLAKFLGKRNTKKWGMTRGFSLLCCCWNLFIPLRLRWSRNMWAPTTISVSQGSETRVHPHPAAGEFYNQRLHFSAHVGTLCKADRLEEAPQTGCSWWAECPDTVHWFL